MKWQTTFIKVNIELIAEKIRKGNEIKTHSSNR